MRHLFFLRNALPGFLVLLATTTVPGPLVPSAQGFSRAPEPLTVPEAARTGNDFGWEIYHQLSETPGNLFFSPASIDLALVMTWSGARGQTAADMADVLHLPGGRNNGPETVLSSFGDLQAQLTPAEGPFTLRIANRLWGQSGFRFHGQFLDPLEEYFQAGLAEVNFRNNLEESRQTINSWVEKQTENKIQELLKPGSIGRDTRLVLTNAIYFLGTWQKIFQGGDTADRPFFLAPGESVQVPTMHQTRQFSYAEDDLVQVISLPYRDGQVEMVIVLPRKDSDLTGIEERLDQKQLDQWSASLSPNRVKLYLPKFTLTGEFSLKDVLTRMGMGSAFSAGADFTGMADEGGLAISDVIHKSFIDVYEKGTEAAAATAVVIRTTSMPGMDPRTVTFKADHPFLFLIRDTSTGAILFLGRVTDPVIDR